MSVCVCVGSWALDVFESEEAWGLKGFRLQGLKPSTANPSPGMLQRKPLEAPCKVHA